MKIHHLSETALNAPKLSPSDVAPKLKAGWRWHRLVPSFCTAGGAGTYSRALVSPAGEVAYVGDRADGPDAAAIAEVLEIGHEMVRLSVPFAEKDEARQLGARWIGAHKTWACAPDQRFRFSRWGALDAPMFDLMA